MSEPGPEWLWEQTALNVLGKEFPVTELLPVLEATPSVPMVGSTPVAVKSPQADSGPCQELPMLRERGGVRLGEREHE